MKNINQCNTLEAYYEQQLFVLYIYVKYMLNSKILDLLTPRCSNDHFLVTIYSQAEKKNSIFKNKNYWVVFQHLYSKLRLVQSNQNYKRNSTKCL